MVLVVLDGDITSAVLMTRRDGSLIGCRLGFNCLHGVRRRFIEANMLAQRGITDPPLVAADCQPIVNTITVRMSLSNCVVDVVQASFGCFLLEVFEDETSDPGGLAVGVHREEDFGIATHVASSQP